MVGCDFQKNGCVSVIVLVASGTMPALDDYERRFLMVDLNPQLPDVPQIPASFQAPLILKKSGYERANPNQPFYAKFQKRNKKNNRK